MSFKDRKLNDHLSNRQVIVNDELLFPPKTKKFQKYKFEGYLFIYYRLVCQIDSCYDFFMFSYTVNNAEVPLIKPNTFLLITDRYVRLTVAHVLSGLL